MSKQRRVLINDDCCLLLAVLIDPLGVPQRQPDAAVGKVHSQPAVSDDGLAARLVQN